MSKLTTKLLTAAAFATLACTAIAPAEARMSLNGQFQNGQFQNGQFQNGQFQNGQFQNGVSHQGSSVNGQFQNGISHQGSSENGINENGSTAQGSDLSPTLKGYVVLGITLPSAMSEQGAIVE